MNMGIGFFEILLILLLLLLFFGSKELPRFMRDGARFIAKLRRYGDKVKEEFDEVTRDLDGPPPLPHDTAVANKKKELRKKYLAARNALDPAERKRKSETICDLLKNSERFKRADAIMIYLNMGAEVETRPLIEAMLGAGKRVVLPYCRRETRGLGIGEIRNLENDIVIGEKSVPEPRSDLRDHFFRSDLQIIVCPGVAFDSFGARLGRGFAYYDNFLRELKGRVPIVGLGFDIQILDEQLPFSYSDVVMDQIITETGFRLPEPTNEPGPQHEKSQGTAETPEA